MVDHKFPDEPVASITILIKLSNQFDSRPACEEKLNVSWIQTRNLFVGYFWNLTKLTAGWKECLTQLKRSLKDTLQQHKRTYLISPPTLIYINAQSWTDNGWKFCCNVCLDASFCSDRWCLHKSRGVLVRFRFMRCWSVLCAISNTKAA